jgi:homocysteine S-methyltransferase
MVAREPFSLFEGAVIERLRRSAQISLDPHVLHAGLIYDADHSAALASIYGSYLDIGRNHNLPMVVLTPTWRANPERVALARLGDVHDVNRDAYRFLASIRGQYGEYARRVWIGGLMGCKGDAYRPQEALSSSQAARFHAPQAQALAEAGADFAMAATLPAVSEALGMANAIAEARLPYVLSFVVRPTGALLDGTPLNRAIDSIDASVDPPPLAYMVNCVHPSVFEQALRCEGVLSPRVHERLIGLQANTSARAPEELDNAECLESAEPDMFADAMMRLHINLGIKALGGCCGTDDRHIACIAHRAAAHLQAIS